MVKPVRKYLFFLVFLNSWTACLWPLPCPMLFDSMVAFYWFLFFPSSTLVSFGWISPLLKLAGFVFAIGFLFTGNARKLGAQKIRNQGSPGSAEFYVIGWRWK